MTWVGPDQAFFDHSSFNRHGVNFILAPPNRNRIDRVFCHRRITNIASTIENVDVYYAGNVYGNIYEFSQRIGSVLAGE